MKNIIIVFAVCFLFSCETETDTIQEEKSTIQEKGQLAFDVVIKLVDEYSGQEVPAGTLPGYVATNLDTNNIYYTSWYEVELFESLPVGTYRFDAYDGYFDGASSAIVEVNTENETPEGWIVVTLRYWSE
ncbi:hypothetical protein [uncultured Aquimarina sp.]|uniref:hypothetical protein n=1 Tax=uncultured Aquimarina sp. TaxID=575652 RepID=UPI00261486A1|nr:hypothetical protein [uncultured Aquimarina sp.]